MTIDDAKGFLKFLIENDSNLNFECREDEILESHLKQVNKSFGSICCEKLQGLSTFYVN